MATTGPSSSWAEQPNSGKGPGIGGSRALFLWAEVWNGVILQTNGTVLTFWKKPLQTGRVCSMMNLHIHKSSTFENVYFSERRWFYREPDTLPQRKKSIKGGKHK